MRTKLTILFVTVISSCSVSVFGQFESKQIIKDVITQFEKAIQTKDTSMLSGAIADNFGVSTTTWPASARLLERVFNRTEQLESLKLVPEKPVSIRGDKQKVKVWWKETGKEPIETYMIVNKNNHIEYVDYLDQLFGKFRHQEARLRTQVPIELAEFGSIILSIRLNDHPRKLRFLFDSGADGMAISNALADTLGLKISRKQETTVVGGKMNVTISSGNTVYLDTFKLSDQSIALFETVRQGIDGIIGLNLAKSFITHFNLDQLQLSLYDFGDYTYEKEGETIEITIPRSIPIIPASLDLTGSGYVEGRFAFDSGANYYLLGFSSFVRKNKLLASGFNYESQSSTISLGKSTPTFNGKCNDFRINQIHLKEMPVSLQGGRNWDANADGSIGIRFISRYNFTINLLEKEIHLTPNKRAIP